MTLTRERIITSAVLVLLLGLPVFGREFHVTLFNYIGIYSLIALGLVMLTGAGGLISFGQAAFFGIGAYATAWWTAESFGNPWVGLLLSIVLTMLSAAVISAVTLPLSGHYLPLATIAWGVAISFLFGNLEILGRHAGISDIPPIEILGTSLGSNRTLFVLVWGIVGISTFLSINILDSREGRSIRALRGGSDLVESLGIRPSRSKFFVFMLAAVLAGIAGWLYAHMQRYVSPAPFSLGASIEFVFMALLGGAGSPFGAILGSTFVVLLKSWLQDILPYFTSRAGNIEAIVYGALFIILLQRSRGHGLTYALGRLLPKPQSKRPTAAHRLPRRHYPECETILEVNTVTKRFGGLVAVDEVSFSLARGETLAIIGPNGAGKSTLFNLISGHQASSSGQINFLGENITRFSAHRIASRGVARTFQHVKLRPEMTVLENVMLGATLRTRAGFLAGALRLDRDEENRTRQEAIAQLERVGLADHYDSPAGQLPLGKQRILEIARSLAADPTLIMLDEPAAGLRRLEKTELGKLLRELRRQAITVLLVEHDVDFIMSLADRVVVLHYGKLIANDTPATVRNNPQVQEAYLGAVA